jgi:hypothetical protein
LYDQKKTNSLLHVETEEENENNDDNDQEEVRIEKVPYLKIFKKVKYIFF